MHRFRLPILALMGGVLLGAQAPAQTVDFTLPDLQGKPHKLSDYRGKWVLVNYWATWCAPCIAEMPGIHELYKQVHPQVGFVMINRD